MLLKKSSHQSVAELSRQMNITPMAVRQHIMSLEKRGLITSNPKKIGIGRPVFLYTLTEKARDIFPQSYGAFALNLLGIIENEDGRKKVDRLFLSRMKRSLNGRYQSMGDHEGIDGKVWALAEILNNEGFMVEVEEDERAYKIKQYNCPLHIIANKYPEACKYELKQYSELLGMSLDRVECQTRGDSACVYVIPKA